MIALKFIYQNPSESPTQYIEIHYIHIIKCLNLSNKSLKLTCEQVIKQSLLHKVLQTEKIIILVRQVIVPCLFNNFYSNL